MSNHGGYLYAIGAEGTSLVKIGYAKKAESRLKHLQTGQPFCLRLLAAIAVEEDVRRVEQQIHAFLTEERRRGEWFDVLIDEEKLASLVLRAVTYLAEKDAEERKHIQVLSTPLSLRETFGKRLKHARENRKLSQPELAVKAGMSVTTLNRLENGHQSLYIEKLVALARVLDTTTDYLLGLEDDEKNEREPTAVALVGA